MNSLSSIKIIVLDVDGTLTDGKIYYDNNGNEIKSFNVKDGIAIVGAQKVGIKIAIITGRSSLIVEKRAKELGVKYVYQGVSNKITKLNEILEKLRITNDEVLYVGDDINDLNIIKKLKYSACPSDAAKEIVENCFFVSKYKGGEGAVREIIEEVLIKKSLWETLLNKF